MKNKLIIKYLRTPTLLLMCVFYSSCKQNQTTIPKETVKANANEIITSPDANALNFHTKYEYTDLAGKLLILENSFSRGGSHTGTDGKEYFKIMFWTRIINATENPLELKMDLPVDSYEVPTLPGKYFKILLPSDTMTLDSEPLQDYGIKDLKYFLDNNIHKPVFLKRTINAKASSGFFVVVLFDNGVLGPFRTGLYIKGQNLFYKVTRYAGKKGDSLVDEKEINCGRINLKNLRLHKKQKSIIL